MTEGQHHRQEDKLNRGWRGDNKAGLSSAGSTQFLQQTRHKVQPVQLVPGFPHHLVPQAACRILDDLDDLPLSECLTTQDLFVSSKSLVSQ